MNILFLSFHLNNYILYIKIFVEYIIIEDHLMCHPCRYFKRYTKFSYCFKRAEKA